MTECEDRFTTQPEFSRPYRDFTMSQLLDITESVPRDFLFSERLNWENRITHAYAEIGIRSLQNGRSTS